MFKKMINFFKDEEGATMVEYGLMLALIAVFCVGAVTYIGTQADTLFNAAGDELAVPAGAPAP